jgi:saccharopine dehydrogenase (NAD+, L-lysine-forming)
MRIVALGASGNAGREIAVLLGPGLAAGDDLVLAGRDPARLERTRAAVTGPARVSVERVDVEAAASVRRLVEGADLVIVTVSRPDLAGDLARIVLEADADWFDTMLSTAAKLAALRELHAEIGRKGRCFVTDGGFHPGVPAALVRWAATQLEEIREADVMGGMRLDWLADTLSDSTVAEMLDEFDDFDLATWVDGERRPLRWSECPTVDFGPPIGRKTCMPMPLAEMDILPRMHPSLRRCGFYISGFSPLMDYAALPVIMGLARFARLRPLTIRFTRWSMGHLASYPPPHRLVLRLTATGHNDGTPARAVVTVSGDDGYLLTAAPAVACLRRVLDGTIRRPGLHLQAHLVEPGPFLGDLAALGLQVETRVGPVPGAGPEAGRV